MVLIKKQTNITQKRRLAVLHLRNTFYHSPFPLSFHAFELNFHYLFNVQPYMIITTSNPRAFSTCIFFHYLRIKICFIFTYFRISCIASFFKIFLMLFKTLVSQTLFRENLRVPDDYGNLLFE